MTSNFKGEDIDEKAVITTAIKYAEDSLKPNKTQANQLLNEMLQETTDSQIRALTLFYLAKYEAFANPDKAIEKCNEILTKYPTLMVGPYSISAMANFELGEVYCDYKKEYTKGLEYYQKANAERNKLPPKNNQLPSNMKDFLDGRIKSCTERQAA